MRRLLLLTAVLLTAACTLQTAGAPTGDVTLSATFDDVQSLVAGHSVQIADVHVGTVTDVRLDGYRAKVTMSIQPKIPEGTTAKIAKTSILGENYVSLSLPPGKGLTTGPFLPNGATISKTSVEPDIEQVTEKAGPLIDALSAQDVNAVLDAAATAFGGRGEELNRLIQRTTEITGTYARSRQDIATTVDGLAKLGRDLAKGSPELDQLPVTLDRATTRLVHGRQHIKQTILSLTAFAKAGNKIFYPRHAARLRTLLTRLDAIANSMVRGKDDLKALIAQLQRWIDAPPITVNGQMLIYVWLKGLISDKPDKQQQQQGSLLGLLEPPV